VILHSKKFDTFPLNLCVLKHNVRWKFGLKFYTQNVSLQIHSMCDALQLWLLVLFWNKVDDCVLIRIIGKSYCVFVKHFWKRLLVAWKLQQHDSHPILCVIAWHDLILFSDPTAIYNLMGCYRLFNMGWIFTFIAKGWPQYVPLSGAVKSVTPMWIFNVWSSIPLKIFGTSHMPLETYFMVQENC